MTDGPKPRALSSEHSWREWRRLYEETPAILHSIGRDGRIEYVSNAWLRAFGYEREEVIGHRSTEFLTAESAEHAKSVIVRFFRDGFCTDVPYDWVCKDGTVRHVQLSATAERDEAGEIVRSLAIIEDVTELKSANKRLARSFVELERSHAELGRINEELEQFVYVSTHDLREPMRMMTSYVELLEESLADSLTKEQVQYMSYIQEGAARMQQMLTDLVALSRVGGRPGPAAVSLTDVVTEAALIAGVAQAESILSIGDLPEVAGHEIDLLRAFQNILGNAIKFRRADVQLEIHVSALRDGPFWIIEVRDNGIGFEPHFADRIFKMFQRLHLRDAYEGTGIGLAIVMRVAMRHGGTAWAESKKGEGSTFFLKLPAIGATTEELYQVDPQAEIRN